MSHQKDAELARLRTTVDSLTKDRDVVKAELAALAKQRETFAVEIQSVARAREKLATELESFLRQHEVTKPQIRAAVDRDDLASRIEGLARAEAALREELSALQARVDALTPSDSSAVTARIDELARGQAELQARLVAAEKRLGAGGGAGPDDLRRIRGIGPRFEAALIERGHDSFAKIAAWSEETIDDVAKSVGTTPERIRRENWVASAKRLAGG